MAGHGTSAGLRNSLRLWILGCAGLVFLSAQDAGAGVQALESSVATRAGTYLGASGWQYQADTRQAAGASGLQAAANLGLALGNASTTVNSSAVLNFADSGQGSLSYVWSNLADVPGGPNNPGSGGRVDAVFAPGSVYNSGGQVTAIATYAFAVGGGGTLDLNWTVSLTDPAYGSLNDFVWRSTHVQLATLDRFHNDQLAESQSFDQALVRSSSAASLPFSALAGDTMVLRLLPNYGFSQDGSRVNSKLYGDLNLQFSVTAVPEPQIHALLMAGIVIVGWASRQRKLSPSSARQESSIRAAFSFSSSGGAARTMRWLGVG